MKQKNKRAKKYLELWNKHIDKILNTIMEMFYSIWLKECAVISNENRNVSVVFIVFQAYGLCCNRSLQFSLLLHSGEKVNVKCNFKGKVIYKVMRWWKQEHKNAQKPIADKILCVSEWVMAITTMNNDQLCWFHTPPLFDSISSTDQIILLPSENVSVCAAHHHTHISSTYNSNL